MTAELRRIHALNGGDAVGEISGVAGPKVIFEDINTLSHLLKIEMSRSIPGALIIAKPILILVG